MKLSDKLWMAFNKKPCGKMTAYFYVVGSWLIGGIVWTVAILRITLSIGPQEKSWALISLPVFAVLYSVLLTRIDYKHKYVDAIHEHYLQRRQTKLDEITHASE